MLIVSSPTDKWFKEAIRTCKESLTVASPFVGDYLPSALAAIDRPIECTLLTRTLLADFASGSSDFEAVVKVARRFGGVLSLSSLHAKVYVVDRSKALVTSANATFSGMYRNRECGIEITQRTTVEDIARNIVEGFGALSAPQRWSLADLESMRGPIEAFRAAMPKASNLKSASISASPRLKLKQTQIDRLASELPGWMQLTLEGVTRIPSDEFTLQQVYDSCLPIVTKTYPSNQHPKQKLRQQLQRLRDLGLVSFLGKGSYERLVVVGQ